MSKQVLCPECWLDRRNIISVPAHVTGEPSGDGPDITCADCFYCLEKPEVCHYCKTKWSDIDYADRGHPDSQSWTDWDLVGAHTLEGPCEWICPKCQVSEDNTPPPFIRDLVLLVHQYMVRGYSRQSLVLQMLRWKHDDSEKP